MVKTKKKKTNTIKPAESDINAPGRLTNQNLHLKWVLAVHTRIQGNVCDPKQQGWSGSGMVEFRIEEPGFARTE